MVPELPPTQKIIDIFSQKNIVYTIIITISYKKTTVFLKNSGF